jgi:nitronate monooxygenase
MFLTDDLATQAGTVSLVERIVAAVRVPVIAAGGIADAEDVASTLAAAAQVGTAYLLCPQARTSRVHRRALTSPRGPYCDYQHLHWTNRPRHREPSHCRNSGGIPPFPLAASPLLPMRSAAEARGSGDFSPLWAGQNLQGCRSVPAAELTFALTTRL